MSIIRVGSTEKYASGWEAAFKGKKKAAAEKPAPAKGKPAKAKKAVKAKKVSAKKK